MKRVLDDEELRRIATGEPLPDEFDYGCDYGCSLSNCDRDHHLAPHGPGCHDYECIFRFTDYGE